MSKSSFCNKFIAFSRLEHTTASCHWAFEFLTNSRLYFLVQLTWWVDFWFPKAMYPLSLFSQASFWLVRKVPPKAVLGHRQKTPCRGKERGQMEEKREFQWGKGGQVWNALGESGVECTWVICLQGALLTIYFILLRVGQRTIAVTAAVRPQ